MTTFLIIFDSKLIDQLINALLKIPKKPLIDRAQKKQFSKEKNKLQISIKYDMNKQNSKMI